MILNGCDRELDIDMSRYEQALVPGRAYRDVLTGQTIVPFAADPLQRTMKFTPRQILILEPVK